MNNPLDMQELVFLVLFIILGTGVNLYLYSLLWQKEKDGPDKQLTIDDPYKLAYLRAGTSETLRVVIFSLIDRGLLHAGPRETVVAAPNAREMVSETIELTVVDFFTKPRKVREIFDRDDVIMACYVYSDALNKEDIYIDRFRSDAPFAALYVLIGISVAGIAIEFSQGRQHIEYLIVLSIIFTMWPIYIWSKSLTGMTRAGKEVLPRARIKFKHLKDNHAANLRPGGMTNDAVFLDAVFGMAALPSDLFPYVSNLFPEAFKTFSGNPPPGGWNDGSQRGAGCGGGCGG